MRTIGANCTQWRAVCAGLIQRLELASADVLREVMNDHRHLRSLVAITLLLGTLGCTSDFHQAATTGDLSTLRRMLEDGYPVDSMDGLGMTALHRSARSCRPAVAEVVVTHGAQLDRVTDFESTALILAVANHCLEVVNVLLDAGADIDASGARGITPLEVSAGDGLVAIARVLIEQGAVLDSRNAAGWTPLMVAAQRGHPQVLELLLRAGANNRLRDELGQDALHHASQTTYFLLDGSEHSLLPPADNAAVIRALAEK